MVGDFFMSEVLPADLPGGYCVAKKNTSEVADHAADHPGKVVWQLPDNILMPIGTDHGNSFHKTLTKKN